MNDPVNELAARDPAIVVVSKILPEMMASGTFVPVHGCEVLESPAAYRVLTHALEQQRLALRNEELKQDADSQAKKVGRNEPCPCGSKKKYKYCCGDVR